MSEKYFENQVAPSEISEQTTPEELGNLFNKLDFIDFVQILKKSCKDNPQRHVRIFSEWADVRKARSAKALWDQYASKLHIDSITISATREQYREDVNAFQSGVNWKQV